LLDPNRVTDALEVLPAGVARLAHACSHTTISPNVIHGGQKTNTIPDVVDINVDIRTIPGETQDTADEYIRDALGDLADKVEIAPEQGSEPTRSPIDNPLWDALRARTQVVYPGAELMPGLITGGTDARYFRQRGAIAYGAALLSPNVTFSSFGQRFHGNDERIDVESLGLSTEFWTGVARHLLDA
jgi:acetylornithine deacetylase/succinyl-diaminopimelate desuccinylase-like protein